jgi:hypothetical protein
MATGTVLVAILRDAAKKPLLRMRSWLVAKDVVARSDAVEESAASHYVEASHLILSPRRTSPS